MLHDATAPAGKDVTSTVRTSTQLSDLNCGGVGSRGASENGDAVNFEELQRAVFAAHAEGAYQQALGILDSAERSLADEDQGRLAFWRACFASLAGRPTEALAVLEDGLARGVWWDPQLLDRDPDLVAMRQLDGYETLRSRLLDHQEQVATVAAPKLLVELPPPAIAKPCPVLLVLHGAWSSAARTRPYCSAALDAGWALALAQSSQPVGSDAFVWTDRDRALAELREHIDTLEARGDVDVERGVLGGFSQGAALALRAVLADEVPLTRFIAQAPSFGSISVDPVVADHHPRKHQIEGVVLVGTADQASDDATTMAAALERRVGRCDLEVVEDLGHDSPPDFPDRLHRWLATWHAGDSLDRPEARPHHDG